MSEKTTTVVLDPNAPPPLTDLQKEIKAAKKGTSKVEAGGAEKSDDFRVETEGVRGVQKADFDSPESPMISDPKLNQVGPKAPGKVEVGIGETPAQHESHTLVGSPAMIAERIELESGEKGLPTDVIARRQMEDVAANEFQRISPGMVNDGGISRDESVFDGEKKATNVVTSSSSSTTKK